MCVSRPLPQPRSAKPPGGRGQRRHGSISGESGASVAFGAAAERLGPGAGLGSVGMVSGP